MRKRGPTVASTKAVNSKIEALNAAFAAIGTPAGNGTAMPRSRRNLEPIAWEYLAAKHLAKIATARYEKAAREAIKAGVLFDHKAEPQPEGTSSVVYDGDVVRIVLSVTAGRPSIDHDSFCDDLAKRGVDAKILNSLTAKHTSPGSPPHTFTPSLVTDR